MILITSQLKESFDVRQWERHVIGGGNDGSFSTAVSNSFLSPLEKSHSCRFGII